MKINILGCHGGVAPGYRTSSYRINGDFLIDAGSAASALSPKEQLSINDILITHAHIDHIKDICFLIENTFFEERTVLNLRSNAVILDHIHKHMFNDILWPDFSKIYVDKKNTKVLLNFAPLDQGFEIDGIKIHFYDVNHIGPALGYLLDDGEKQVLFTGDTGPTDLIWEKANQCKNLKAVFTEVSFPNAWEDLAKVSGHFTLAQLNKDLEKLKNKDIPIYIAHFKPRFFEDLMDEFHRGASSRMHLLHQDDEITL